MWRHALLAIPALTGIHRPDARRLPPFHVQRDPRSPAQAAKPERATDLLPGESLTYRVQIRGIESARAALAVGKPGKEKERRVVPLRGAVEPLPAFRVFVPFRVEMVSYVDKRAGVPRRTLSTRTVDKRDVRLETRYLDGAIEVRQDGGKPARLRARPEATTHDPLTALWSLRSRAHPKGERFRVRVLDGRAEHRVEIVAGAIGTLETALGPMAAQRFDGRWRAAGRRPVRTFSLWLSADEARIPLRLEGETRLGPASFELIAYTRPEAKTHSARAQPRR